MVSNQLHSQLQSNQILDATKAKQILNATKAEPNLKRSFTAKLFKATTTLSPSIITILQYCIVDL